SQYALSALLARLGATDLAGDLRWFHGEQRDRVRAELTSESTDLADLRSLGGRAPAAARTAATRTSAPAAAGSAPAGTAGARPLDVELRYAARRLHGAGNLPLQSARLEASLVDSRLDVPRF